MKSYLELLEFILNNGTQKQDRTGTGTLSCFAQSIRVDLTKGFPLLTTKKLHWKSILFENLWFLHPNVEVSSSNNFLVKNGVSIWKEWQGPGEELGEVYGVQYRHYPLRDGKTFDQIESLLEKLKTNPNDRRMVVNAWNVDSIQKEGPHFSGALALPPCHYSAVFNVTNGKLNCMMTMRSTDVFLGLPYNIAGYALWTYLFAHLSNLEVGELVVHCADCHLYSNHIEQAKLQLTRGVRALPTLSFSDKLKSLSDLYNEDDSVNSDYIILQNYDPHPNIKAEVAI